VGMARQLFIKAAMLGNARAHYAVAWTYEQGHGVTQDYVEACRWYITSLRAGFADAEKRITCLISGMVQVI
jgi:TPR repeat protein